MCIRDRVFLTGVKPFIVINIILIHTSISGMAERGDIMAILDQIQWQCTKCHIILGGTYYRCTVPDCTGTKFGALKELLTLLGRLFVEGEEEKSDSFTIITLADYVNILLDAHGLAEVLLTLHNIVINIKGHRVTVFIKSRKDLMRRLTASGFSPHVGFVD